VRATGTRRPAADRQRDVVRRRRRAAVRELRPGACGVDARVVVRAAEGGLAPGRLALRLDAVLVREPLDAGRVEALDHAAREVVERARPRAVLDLEGVHQEKRLLDVLDRERSLAPVGPILRAHERVRHEDREVVVLRALAGDLLVHVRDHLVDVAPQAVDLGELRLGHVRDRHVDVASILGERRRHLRADEDVAKAAVEQLLRAVDRVVIGERDEVHPSLEEEPVQLERLGVRLRDRESVGGVVIGDVGRVRMKVEIDLRDLGVHVTALLPTATRAVRGLLGRFDRITLV